MYKPSDEGLSESVQVHAIILTFNEELHIARGIESLGQACASVTVVDSGSSDQTVEIATRLGAHVLQNKWVNYSTQMNFAIDALKGKGGWLLRIDADEILDPDSSQSITAAVNSASAAGVNGFLVQRRIQFMGRRMKHGGIEPSWQLRLWRNGLGRCEQRWMDEHIAVQGKVSQSGVVISDINLNSLTWWTNKHNSYASREALDILIEKYKLSPKENSDVSGLSHQAKLKRTIKTKVYNILPKGLRSLLYFVFRYVFRLGFLDGKPGWYFHVLQGFWYRTLVDAKVMEIEACAADRAVSIPQAITICTGLDMRHAFADGCEKSSRS